MKVRFILKCVLFQVIVCGMVFLISFLKLSLLVQNLYVYLVSPYLLNLLTSSRSFWWIPRYFLPDPHIIYLEGQLYFSSIILHCLEENFHL